MRAFIWIGIALAIGVFFPAIGAILLNPFWAVLIVLGLILLVAQADEAVEEK